MIQIIYILMGPGAQKRKKSRHSRPQGRFHLLEFGHKRFAAATAPLALPP
jgi:hypothetical protein